MKRMDLAGGADAHLEKQYALDLPGKESGGDSRMRIRLSRLCRICRGGCARFGRRLVVRRGLGYHVSEWFFKEERQGR
jgi:hypothetical protein